MNVELKRKILDKFEKEALLMGTPDNKKRERSLDYHLAEAHCYSELIRILEEV